MERVLIVTAAEVVAASVRGALEMEGYVCTVCGSGEAALALVATGFGPQTFDQIGEEEDVKGITSGRGGPLGLALVMVAVICAWTHPASVAAALTAQRSVLTVHEATAICASGQQIVRDARVHGFFVLRELSGPPTTPRAHEYGALFDRKVTEAFGANVRNGGVFVVGPEERNGEPTIPDRLWIVVRGTLSCNGGTLPGQQYGNPRLKETSWVPSTRRVRGLGGSSIE